MKKPNRFREYQSRLSLTLLFAGTVIIVMLAVLLFVGTLALILFNTGVMDQSRLAVNGIILLSLLFCFLVGVVSALLFGRLFMKPINSIINMMNRLAGGDYTPRICFHSIFDRHPAVAELTDSINKMAEELQHTEELRSDFINNFSHEFKTPIVSIAGFAKLLQDGQLSREKQQEYLSIIEEESMRLSVMATNVLNLTRVENQTILSEVTSYNLSEQIRNCFLVLEKKWSEKQLELGLDFPEFRITGNEELLRQVWLNLLDNAIKFTPEKGFVGVTLEKTDEKMRVCVANTGSFILEADRERIFRKFYQADTSHATKGNGVGLAVVRQIVWLHGGTVAADSDEKGTRFWVEIPQNF